MQNCPYKLAVHGRKWDAGRLRHGRRYSLIGRGHGLVRGVAIHLPDRKLREEPTTGRLQGRGHHETE